MDPDQIMGGRGEGQINAGIEKLRQKKTPTNKFKLTRGGPKREGRDRKR